MYAPLMFVVNRIEIYIAYTLLFRNQKGFFVIASGLMVKKLKISTLDGAETTRKTQQILSDSGLTKYRLYKFQFH